MPSSRVLACLVAMFSATTSLAQKPAGVYEGKPAQYWADLLALSPKDLSAQYHAKTALMTIGAPSTKRLCPLVKNDDIRVRQVAWEILEDIQQRHGLAAVRPVLACAIEVLKSNGEGIGFVAAFGAEADSVIPAILDMRNLSGHGFPGYALVSIGSPAAIAALVPFLEDEDGDTRKAAAETLAKFGSKARGQFSEVVRLLNRPDHHDCVAAAHALKDIGAPLPATVVTALVNRLQVNQSADEGINQYNECRGATLDAIGAAGETTTEAVPALVGLLGDDLIGGVAAATLQRLGPAAKPAMARVVELMWTPTGAVDRNTLAGILRNIGPAAIPDLEKMAKDPSDDLRGPAMAALAGIRKAGSSNTKTKKHR